MREGGGEDEDDEGRVLSADELDISEQEEVASLGEGRFVVGSDGPPAAPDEAVEDALSDATDSTSADDSALDDSGTDDEESATTDQEGGDETSAPSETPTPSAEPTPDAASRGITGRDVKSWLADELTSHDSNYAYHITAKSGADVANQQLATDDISAAFDGLLVWYARQVATDTPVDEALGILLAESRVKVRYPTSRLVEYLDANDLGPEDSIGDLVAAVADDDGLVFTKQ